MSIRKIISLTTRHQVRHVLNHQTPYHHLRNATKIHSASIFTTAVQHGGGEKKAFVGPGAKPGTIPTDLEQSTGLERFEYLSQLEGREAFDMQPLQVTHLGTTKDPIKIKSVDNYRYVGCTGFPTDSHDTIWMTVSNIAPHVDRCPECGCCFQLEVVNAPTYPE